MEWGEFMSRGGDPAHINWDMRRHGIVNVLQEVFEHADVIVTQENDHFFWILHELKRTRKIEGVFLAKGQPPKPSNARKFGMKRLHAALCPDAGKTSFDDQYNACNAIIKSSGGARTFEAEHVPESFCNMFGLGPADLYMSDDGVGIYWKSDSVSLKQVLHADKVNVVKQSCHYSCKAGTSPVFGCRFAHGDNEVDVYGAHLKSGEKAPDEAKRMDQLNPLLVALRGNPKPVVILAMDSNNSELYEAGMSKGPGEDKKGNKFNLQTYMSEAIADAGCVDLVKTYDRNTECFKMRHARGGQPKKFGQLMFDSIDKILVNANTRTLPASPVVLNSYQKLRDNDSDAMRTWRTDKACRAAIKKACLEEKWGDNMEQNKVPASLSQALGLSEAKIKEIFLQLYPNVTAPSDHPPCISPPICLASRPAASGSSFFTSRIFLSAVIATMVYFYMKWYQ